MQLPATEDEWKAIATGFNDQWNFPNCLGAVDGKHVAIKKPPHTGSHYYNYKKFFSIVMMAVVNCNYEFIMVDVGINGRISDGGVLAHTAFGKALSDKSLQIPKPASLPNSERIVPFVFVGDDAFALTENFMKPYSQTGLTVSKRIFNYRLSRARRVVENAFGILVSKFGVFQRPIALSPEKSQIIVLACCYLHNYLRRNQSQRYMCSNSIDVEDFESGSIVEGSWRTTARPTSLRTTHARNSPTIAKAIRDSYCDFFNNEGQISWQHKFV